MKRRVVGRGRNITVEQVGSTRESSRPNKGLNEHIEREHPPKDINTFFCDTCNKYFSNWHSLKQHEDRNHRIQQHICSCYNVEFQTKGVLKRHSRLEHQVKECAKCDFVAESGKKLRGHMKICKQQRDGAGLPTETAEAETKGIMVSV